MITILLMDLQPATKMVLWKGFPKRAIELYTGSPPGLAVEL